MTGGTGQNVGEPDGAAPGTTEVGPVGEAFDFVIVGSGAGGRPTACNLAEAGHRVLLLEAGTDHDCPYYQVPLFHPAATEDPHLAWSFFVRHYADDVQQRRDSKFVPDRDGVLYPRGATLGGSTAVSAMVTLAPQPSDFDAIAAVTGDPSWSGELMRRYTQRVERVRYLPTPADPVAGASSGEGADPARHGYEGWLQVERAAPELARAEPQWLAMFDAVAQTVRAELGDQAPSDPVDPGDWRVVRDGVEGAAYVPLATADGQRNGTRERILATAAAVPEQLVVLTGALVTRVLLDDDQRAIGVEYAAGAGLYRADGGPAGGDSITAADNQRGGLPPELLRTATARREVVLAAGTFNSPQLLQLSGIGPRAELEALGIEVRVDLPGVGRNLQDRYEVGVVSRVDHDYQVFTGATLDAPAPGQPGDAPYQQWQRDRTGMYSTNGALVGIIKKSQPQLNDPDLFVFGIPGYFRGYYPGYSQAFREHADVFTWAVLKAHTSNRGGHVRLRSTDPRNAPHIDFRYLQEGTDTAGHDLEAVVDGILLARAINERAPHVVRTELLPGPDVRTSEQLRQFVRDQAWGHHASGTCAIGADDDPNAVLDSRLRVRGTRGLRVVDASVFPRIPGLLLVTSVYAVSEKASDDLLAEHPGRATHPQRPEPVPAAVT